MCSTGIVMKFGSDRIISGMLGSDESYGTLSMEEPAPSIDKSWWWLYAMLIGTEVSSVKTLPYGSLSPMKTGEGGRGALGVGGFEKSWE